MRNKPILLGILLLFGIWCIFLLVLNVKATSLDLGDFPRDYSDSSNLTTNCTACEGIGDTADCNCEEYERCKYIYAKYYEENNITPSDVDYCLFDTEESEKEIGILSSENSEIDPLAREYVLAAVCSNCHNSNYESNEDINDPYCQCDEYEKCKNPFVKSTAYEFGGFNSQKTDYCVNEYTLYEAYIDCDWEDESFYAAIDCPADYYCGEGACEECETSCNNICQSSACYNVDPDCDSDGNPNIVCCGDDICETGETFGNCSEDCFPNISIIPSLLRFIINK